MYRALKARLRDQRLEIRIARQAIRHGDVVLDIGAHKGAYLYWLRKGVGPTGSVHAFEPQPPLNKYLQAIVRSMSWNNVFVRPYAISNTSGITTLHVPAKRGGSSPGARLGLKFKGTADAYQVECEVKTLDSLSFDRPVSFIKCDVEGHELEVFRGGQNLLGRDSPVLLFECEARHLLGHSMNEVFDVLINLGYQGSFIAGDKLLPVSDFSLQIHQRQIGARFWDEPGYYNNFLFRRAIDPAARTRPPALVY